MVTFDLFAQDSQEPPLLAGAQKPRRAGKPKARSAGQRGGALAAATHYRLAMAAAKRIRRARHRDVVGRQICEHLRGMLGAEDSRARSAPL